MIVEELSADDRATLDALMRTEFQQQIRGLLDKLGSNAAAKIIAYAKRDAPHVAPAVHQVLRAKPDDCYQSCGRKAELGSSRCAACGPAARDRAQDRQTRADTAKERLAGFC